MQKRMRNSNSNITIFFINSPQTVFLPMMANRPCSLRVSLPSACAEPALEKVIGAARVPVLSVQYIDPGVSAEGATFTVGTVTIRSMSQVFRLTGIPMDF